MRSGVTIGWATGKKHVENCTVLACETGYWIGSDTTVINCRGDSSLGPLYSEDVGRSNSKGEFTLLDNYVAKVGNTPSVYFAGDRHELTLYDGTTKFDPSITIKVGGNRVGHRWLAGSDERPLRRDAKNLTLTNYTKYPVVFEDNTSGNTLKSLGAVTDGGSNNKVKQISEGSLAPKSKFFHAFSPIQAEDFTKSFGVQAKQGLIGSLNHRDWVKYEGVTFGAIGTEAFEITLSKEHSTRTRIEVYIDGLDGEKVATIDVPVTSSWSAFQKVKVAAASVTGKHDVYLSFLSSGNRPLVANINSFKFLRKGYLDERKARVNIAVNGSAVQSSTASGGDAARAIDGDTNGVFDEGSVTQTGKGRNPWWGIELEEESEINEIVLFKRADSSSLSSLTNFKVSVYDQKNKLTFSKTFLRINDASLAIDVGGAKGSKIKIQLNGIGAISLAEVEVY